jgi:thioredoxin
MSDFTTDVIALSHQRPVLVDFNATWCPPCRMLAPVLEVAAERNGFQLVPIDTDEHGALAAEHGVSGIPDVRLWHRGKEIGRFVGFRPLPQVEQWVREQLKAAA